MLFRSIPWVLQYILGLYSVFRNFELEPCKRVHRDKGFLTNPFLRFYAQNFHRKRANQNCEIERINVPPSLASAVSLTGSKCHIVAIFLDKIVIFIFNHGFITPNVQQMLLCQLNEIQQYIQGLYPVFCNIGLEPCKRKAFVQI